jgi:hypothetical protein
MDYITTVYVCFNQPCNRQFACYRLIFDLGKKVNSRKELIKISKIAKFGYEML